MKSGIISNATNYKHMGPCFGQANDCINITIQMLFNVRQYHCEHISKEHNILKYHLKLIKDGQL